MSLPVAGDVLLADYEEELPAAWTGSFARKGRDYDVMCALSRSRAPIGEDVSRLTLSSMMLALMLGR